MITFRRLQVKFLVTHETFSLVSAFHVFTFTALNSNISLVERSLYFKALCPRPPAMLRHPIGYLQEFKQHPTRNRAIRQLPRKVI